MQRTTLDQYDETFLRCRKGRCDWDDWTDTGFVTRRREIVRFTHIERCTRCGGIRWDERDAPSLRRTAECRGWRYDRPVGWALDYRYSYDDFLAEIYRRRGVTLNIHEDRELPPRFQLVAV